MNEQTLAVLLPVLFGALAGGLTNAVAVWMLFHPYEPPRFLGRPVRLLQGAIPKNKARLARAIGRTVGTRLLTSEDLASTVSAPEFRAAFDERLGRFVTSLLEKERGSLADILPTNLIAEVRGVLEPVATALLERLDQYLDGEEFRATARRWANQLAEEMKDQPLGEVITPERETALATAAESWIADVVEGPGFEHAVADYIDRTSHRLLQPGQTFETIIPQGLVAAVERGIAGYMPVAIERLGDLLEDPQARARVERVLHEILDRFLGDLKFHQRLVAALVIPPDVIDRVIEAIQAEGVAKISHMMHEAAVRDAMARSVNNAIVDFLRKPVDSVLGRPGEPSVEQAKGTINGWMLGLARDPQTRGFLIDRLRRVLASAEDRTWGDVFRHFPPEKVADALVGAARSEQAAALYKEATDRLITLALEKPIGRPADLLPPDAPQRIQEAASDPLWAWLQEQVPAVAQRVDIAGQVERKILDFPMARVEEIIRGVTEKELRLIVRLGYVLGAMIGVLSILVQRITD